MSLNFNQMYYNYFKDYYKKKVKNSDGHNLKNINKSSNYTAYADETPIPVLGYVHICGAVKRSIGSEAILLLRHFLCLILCRYITDRKYIKCTHRAHLFYPNVWDIHSMNEHVF